MHRTGENLVIQSLGFTGVLQCRIEREGDADETTVLQFEAEPILRNVDFLNFRDDALQLTVQIGGTIKQWTYAELLPFDDRVRATLDCTGGFYSTQDWSGVWVSRLLTSFPSPARGGGQGGGSSIHVRSLTGYDRRFAISDAGRLLIATGLGGMPLDPGHGFPVRLVAPDLRGYWWVKWVTTITIDELPSWWQLPFPMQ